MLLPYFRPSPSLPMVISLVGRHPSKTPMKDASMVTEQIRLLFRLCLHVNKLIMYGYLQYYNYLATYYSVYFLNVRLERPSTGCGVLPLARPSPSASSRGRLF